METGEIGKVFKLPVDTATKKKSYKYSKPTFLFLSPFFFSGMQSKNANKEREKYHLLYLMNPLVTVNPWVANRENSVRVVKRISP